MRTRRTLVVAFATVWALLVGLRVAAGPARAAAEPGPWTWPLPPPHQVVAGYAPPAHDWLPGHRGVDLAAVTGEQVLSAGPGVVSFAGRVGGIDVVAVRHVGGLETTYEPVRAGRSTAHVGARVRAGQLIGVIAGRLGHCARICLHWGLRRGSAYLDPLALVGAQRVRLLPLLAPAPAARWAAPVLGGAGTASAAVWLLRRRLRPASADPPP